MSPIALRACLLASAAAGLSACASNPPGREGAAPIDFRAAAPKAPEPAAPIVLAAPRAPVAAVPAAPAPSSNPESVRRVVDVGLSPTGTSAIEEAKSLSPEAGYRPGGTMRQARDNPSARAIEVQSGDTLYDISRRYSVNMRALIETNGMEPPYALDRGDVVYLPPPNVHVVEKGETLYSVSRRYNVDTRSLALLNSMQRPWTVYPGDELQLPPLAREQTREVMKPAQVAAPVVVAKTSPPAALPVVKAPPAKTPVVKPVDDKAISLVGDKAAVEVKAAPKAVIEPPPMPKSTPATPASARDFIWPISGNVLKGFGAGADGIRNDGVNISAAQGAEVRAAAGGEVVYAGSELAGFGNLVLIRHPGGWVTAYAHSDALKVKEGDLVKQGQVIATAGKTGNASSTQVHFELRKGKEPVDPALHLPELRG
ncbi:MAG: LysM peptidoglycan-binding domain-containing M23 family metallopeptidase [Hyphomonadaceae bacterium]|nr:LysM peptidoglycan-binding domain-containing M23 family metallopeptidase [Hyphomonadaceae bacterium]